MKECNVIDSLTGLYMQYKYIVKVKGKPIFSLCDNLAAVYSECNRYRNEFPNIRLCIHRIIVVADVDTQVRKKKNKGFKGER